MFCTFSTCTNINVTSLHFHSLDWRKSIHPTDGDVKRLQFEMQLLSNASLHYYFGTVNCFQIRRLSVEDLLDSSSYHRNKGMHIKK